MSLSKDLIRVCRLLERRDISKKHRIDYYLDDGSSDFAYVVDISMVDTKRYLYITNYIQDMIEDNDLKEETKSDDGSFVIYRTNRGKSKIFYDVSNRSVSIVLFTNRAESDEFYKYISADNIEGDISITPNNPMTVDDFAGVNNDPDSTVQTGGSVDGDNPGSTNIA